MTESAKLDNKDTFAEQLRQCGSYPLKAIAVNTLQMNITRKCNLACKHCHVQAGPHRTEMMSLETVSQCVKVAQHPSITTIDITGGSPEMHPDIDWLVSQMAQSGKRVLVRSNLVILLEPEYSHLIDKFAKNKIEIVGSLPDYRAQRSDRQRGNGIYDKIMEAMRLLNKAGYGRPDSGLLLDLMHNPAGAYLPGSQSALEAEYKRVLSQEHNVFFNTLFCLANCPIGRYLEYLKNSGNLDDYMQTLRKAFNPQTAQKVMCRTTVSVGWDGKLYDCDFNQVENLSVNSGSPDHIFTFNYNLLARRNIEIRDHCFACTAGSGSSCCGSLTV
ncbi:MAG: arsenosugar biosynthesis radical SAM protein ArsS [Phycisphaerae bacterium]|nr:arsenosugar biosynthesis radical SAM protein ArsS [Phycisphaerae bacterium]